MRTLTNRAVAVALLALTFTPPIVCAHGERAQQASTRVRTTNWYDVEIAPTKVSVGDEVIVRGRFRTSKYWPEHLPSVEGRVFLNVGTGGPTFTRVSSSIDGVSMVQSTSLELGRDYGFELKLKARTPGRVHVHPLLNVLDTGAMVGPGRWVETTGSQSDFVNEAETMFGRKMDLETFNLNVVYGWHAIWFLIGGAWILYWVRQRPLLIARMSAVEDAEAEGLDADTLITPRDRNVGIGFVVLTLVVVAAGYQWANARHPVTAPLRTAKVSVPKKAPPALTMGVTLDEAQYRIPGRSFQMSLTVENRGSEAMQIGEFATANLRFINPAVRTLAPADSHDLIAPDGLRIEGGPVAPGETRTLKVFAEDALWETQRLTHMINDPDSTIAGLLFFYADNGEREIVEIGGTMMPVFN